MKHLNTILKEGLFTQNVLKEGLFDDTDLEITDEDLANRYLKNWAKTMRNSNLEFQDRDTIIITSDDWGVTVDAEALNKVTELNPKIKFIFKGMSDVRVNNNLKNVSLGVVKTNRWSASPATVHVYRDAVLDGCVINCTKFRISNGVKLKNTQVDCGSFELEGYEKQGVKSSDFSGSVVEANVVIGPLDYLKKQYPESFRDKNFIKDGPTYLKNFDIRKVYQFDFDTNNFLFEKDSRKIMVLMHREGGEWMQGYNTLEIGDRMKQIESLRKGEKIYWFNGNSYLSWTKGWVKIKES